MKCKDIERLIIYSSEEDLSSDELSEIEKHVSECSQCARFQEELQKIRLCIQETPSLKPPADLAKKTQLMCHARINTLPLQAKRNGAQALLARIPQPMWVALFSLIGLTLMWIFSLLEDFKLNQPFSFQTMAILFLVIQNAVMLFFAPILIRKYRMKNQNFRSI
jgi:anti-sigma factor RsiW